MSAGGDKKTNYYPVKLQKTTPLAAAQGGTKSLLGFTTSERTLSGSGNRSSHVDFKNQQTYELICGAYDFLLNCLHRAGTSA